MRVHVENDLYLSADGREYTLERRSVTQSGDNAGKEVFAAFGHYSSLQGAINGLVKIKIAESTATTLQELLASVDAIHDDIRARIVI